VTTAIAKSRSPRQRWHAPEKGTGPAFALSLLAHAVLFIAIAFVVRWKTEPSGTVSAELWSALPAPAPAEVPPPAPPPPEPIKPPPPPPPEPAVPKADIVVAPKKVEPPKPEPPRKEEKKAPLPDLKAEALKREAAEKAQAKAAEAQRLAAINRSLAAAGTPGASPSTAGSTLARGYESQVVSCIRPHIVFNVPEGLRPQQHVAEFEVQLLPTGEQTGAPRLLKPSGLPAYDQAVERAIRRCDPFPRPSEGPMPRSLRLTFDPIETR
jgi:colicin import membrane protein